MSKDICESIIEIFNVYCTHFFVITLYLTLENHVVSICGQLSFMCVTIVGILWLFFFFLITVTYLEADIETCSML